MAKRKRVSVAKTSVESDSEEVLTPSQLAGVELDQKELFKVFLTALLAGHMANPHLIMSASSDLDRERASVEFDNIFDLIDIGIQTLVDRFNKD
jgi:hypothetical protein